LLFRCFAQSPELLLLPAYCAEKAAKAEAAALAAQGSFFSSPASIALLVIVLAVMLAGFVDFL
jgi:hypothetical protein